MPNKIKVDLIIGRYVTKKYGMGRNVDSLISLKKNQKLNMKIVGHNLRLPLPYKSLVASLLVYPLIVIRKRRRKSIFHIAKQEEAYLLNYFKPKNVVVTCHDLLTFAHKPSKIINKIILSLCVKGLRKADRIITISEYSKKDIIKYLNYPKERIDVIYNGIDHKKFNVLKKSRDVLRKYGIPEKNKLLLFVGTEEPRKNLHRIIKAIKKIKKKKSNVMLLKVGIPQNPSRREELKIYINKLGIEDNVKFLDYVSENDLIKIYNSVDLLVFPSLYEGFGFPALEAMACGCPVITSNTTSLPEVVGDAAIKINPLKVNELTESVLRVLTNNNLRKSLIKEGIKQAKKFSWSKNSKETLRVYEKINKNLR